MDKKQRDDMLFVMTQAIQALKEVRYAVNADRVDDIDVHFGNVKKEGEREITISLKTKGFRSYLPE